MLNRLHGHIISTLIISLIYEKHERPLDAYLHSFEND